MKLTILSTCPPRPRLQTVDVRCTAGHRTPALHVEVGRETLGPAQEAELRRQACLQRLTHLRRRIDAHRLLQERVLGSQAESLC